MPATFKPDTIFNSSYKMGDAKISYDRIMAKFPESNCDDDCGKCEFSWSGAFTAADGTVMRASFWDWKGGLRHGFGVSIWVSDYRYLTEFKRFIES
jgi:hypothetical protein